MLREKLWGCFSLRTLAPVQNHMCNFSGPSTDRYKGFPGWLRGGSCSLTPNCVRILHSLGRTAGKDSHTHPPARCSTEILLRGDLLMEEGHLKTLHSALSSFPLLALPLCLPRVPRSRLLCLLPIHSFIYSFSFSTTSTPVLLAPFLLKQSPLCL